MWCTYSKSSRLLLPTMIIMACTMCTSTLTLIFTCVDMWCTYSKSSRLLLPTMIIMACTMCTSVLLCETSEHRTPTTRESSSLVWTSVERFYSRPVLIAELNQLTRNFHAEVESGSLAIDVGLKWRRDRPNFDQIASFEASGYVMSASRHRRMETVRLNRRTRSTAWTRSESWPCSNKEKRQNKILTHRTSKNS
ncbi:NKAPL [Cordylochernes scorpioides]|uniref:NKAPL n=1 Tax=Cordylochernes scorpioides TaxID=51811 RepID=A0ABY6LBC4_9ARAC|nr:NKAPL [Cordylochernes scorpioides]